MFWGLFDGGFFVVWRLGNVQKLGPMGQLGGRAKVVSPLPPGLIWPILGDFPAGLEHSARFEVEEK